MQNYSISEAARELGISTKTLRRWDKAGKVKINRTPNGSRVFTREDIDFLKTKVFPNSFIPKPTIVKQSTKPHLSIPQINQELPSHYGNLLLALFGLVILFAATTTVLFEFSPYPHQAVLGVETFVAPALEESAPLGSLLSRIGSFFENNPVSSFALTIVQKIEQTVPTSPDLTVSGKAQIAKDIEGLGNLKIKGTASVGKLVTGIVDPYLIENDGSVQSTLEIKSVGDIQLEPSSLNINLTNSSLSNVNNITSQGTISGGSLTLSNNSTIGGNETIKGNSSIGGNLTITGNTTLTGTINGNTFNSTQLIFSGSSPSIYPTTANTQISLNASGTGAINIGNSSKGDIYIGGGSTSGTYCLITNSNGSLNCSSDITTGGNLHVNGGTIATSQTSFNLLNDTATTINLGGGATTLKIGATTGTTTVNNALTATGALTGSSTLSITGGTTLSSTLSVSGAITAPTSSNTINSLIISSGSLSGITGYTQSSGNFAISGTGTFSTGTGAISLNGATTLSGNLAVNGGSITTTATTFNLANTTATAVNFAGAATSLAIGNSSGTTDLSGILRLPTAGNVLVFTGSNPTIDFQNSAVGGKRVQVQSTTTGLRINDVDGSSTFYGGENSGPSTTFSFNLSTGALALGSNLTWNTDNASDIGASGATRPRNVYAGTSFIAPAGVVTAPSYTFSGNTNTGIFSSAANTIDLVSASTSMLKIGSTGAVEMQPAGGLGGGNGPMFIMGNVTSAPTIGVANQGMLYISSGALKYQGPSTLTQLAAADYAEAMPYTGDLNQGEVVSTSNVSKTDSDLYNNFYVQRTTEAYDTKLVGVVSSTSPETNNITRMISLVGRVPVKFSAENGPVSQGDYLTSSGTKPGFAMKATRPGRTIGVALQSATSDGQILVFVNPSWYDPQVYLTSDGNLNVGTINANQVNIQGNNLFSVVGLTDKTAISSPSPSPTPSSIPTSSPTPSPIPTASILSRLSSLEILTKNLALSTQSAVLSTSSSSFDNLTITKKLLTQDLGITGTLTQGLLSIKGLDSSISTPSATINTISNDLYLQNLGVGGVNFLNGKVLIDKNGNLTVQKLNVSSNSLGKAILPAGQTLIIIQSPSVATDSAVFITPETVIDAPLSVTQRTAGQSFEVQSSKSFPTDVKFDWWIVN